MNRLQKGLLWYGFIWSEVMVFILSMKEVQMTFFETLTIAIVPSVITACVTISLSHKSQTQKLVDIIESMNKGIGLRENETLSNMIERKYNTIVSDIGRNSGSSLTEQHNIIKQSLEDNYSEIKRRYQIEDDSYRKFTHEQKELTDTMNNFVRDYRNVIQKNHDIEMENITLRKENENLKQELEALKHDKGQLQRNSNRDEREL